MLSIVFTMKVTSCSDSATTAKMMTRYDLYWNVLEKALSKVSSDIDKRALLREVYGDDTEIVGMEMLESVLESTLQNVNSAVREDTEQFMKENQLKAMLERLELVIEKLDTEDEAEIAQEKYDQQLAQSALKMAQLPPGVSTEDLVRFEQYQKIMAEKEELLRELAREEAELAAIERDFIEQSQSTQMKVEQIREVGERLKHSANQCSMVS